MTSPSSEPNSNTHETSETQITITHENEHYIIRDEQTGVTTQGKTKIESLLMLADALAGHPDHQTEPLSTALDVFVPDASMKQLEGELFDTHISYTTIDEQLEHDQKQAALYLAKHHKTLDFSNQPQLKTLLEFLHIKNPGDKQNLTRFIG